MRTLSLAVLSLVVGCYSASAAEVPTGPGMFLCRSPVVAGDFWNGLLEVHQMGVQIDRSVGLAVAAKNGCAFVASANLKPTDYVSGEFKMTDGRVIGWASPELYILYVNRPAP